MAAAAAAAIVDRLYQYIKDILAKTSYSDHLILKIVDSKSGKEIVHYPVPNFQSNQPKRAIDVDQRAKQLQSQIRQLQHELEQIQSSSITSASSSTKESDATSTDTNADNSIAEDFGLRLSSRGDAKEVVSAESTETIHHHQSSIIEESPVKSRQVNASRTQSNPVESERRSSTRARQTSERFTVSEHATATKSPAAKRRIIAPVTTTDADTDTETECEAESSSSEELVEIRPKRLKSVDTTCNEDREEIQMLVNKLLEAHKNIQSMKIEGSLPQIINAEQIIRLCTNLMQLDSARCTNELTAQYYSQIFFLINTSQSMKMIGYYFISILACKLKVIHQRAGYAGKIRQLLGYKSTADIAAVIRFSEFVQQHYPSAADSVQTLQSLMEIPLLNVSISWTEWRRYMGKPHRPLIDKALEEFKLALSPYQDWMELNWVAVVDTFHHQQGVRALQTIPHDPQRKAPNPRQCAADLQRDAPIVAFEELTERQMPYCVQRNRYRFYDLEHHWAGKINHLPMPHCNLRFAKDDKLVQCRAIQAGEELTMDYSMEYWIHHITGLTIYEWIKKDDALESNKSRLLVFRRMHESVHDYTRLINLGLKRQLLNGKKRAVIMEAVLRKIENYLNFHHSLNASSSDPEELLEDCLNNLEF